MEKVNKVIFALLLIFLPSQFGLHFWPEWAFINGVRIDYFSPTLYFTDILVGLLFILSLRGTNVVSDAAIYFRRKKIASSLWLLAMTVFVFFNVYFSHSPAVTVYKWLKVLEFGFLAWYVAKNKPDFKLLIIPIAYSCILAVWQYFNHGSVGGLWYFLGERTFNNSTPGIAPNRPYATFSHPNVLGGFLITSSLIILPHISRKFIALIIVVFFLTLAWHNPLNGLALRHQLNVIAIKQWTKSPIVGTGLGTSPLYPRNITNFALLHQPIHNIFLLVLSETGILGLLGFLVILKKRFSLFLLPILFLGLFDHYWLTLQQGQLLFALILGIIRK